MSAPLVITRDETLLDELLRLAAAAGVTPDVAPDGVGGLAGWSAAPLVLVGADVASRARRAPAATPRGRPRRLVRRVRRRRDGGRPRARRRERRRPAQLGRVGGRAAHRPRRRAAPPGLDGRRRRGRGRRRERPRSPPPSARWRPGRGPTLVVDTDRIGPGLDRVLGMEGRTGVRWDELCRTTGRLGAVSLREGVPRKATLGVLTCYAGRQPPLPAFAVREVVAAAQRGHDTVVVDLPAGARRGARRGAGAVRPGRRGRPADAGRPDVDRAGGRRACPTRGAPPSCCAGRASTPTRSAGC